MMKLTNVHEALQESATAPRPENSDAMITATFRIEKSAKAALMEKCKLHGSDLSSFMRQCGIALLSDYGLYPPPAAAEALPEQPSAE
jgi:hypothetical protein